MLHTEKRQSNIELLRIIAMFMILGLHVNYLAVTAPNAQDIATSPLISFMRIFMENICIVGVNVFVLISGWFGINFKTKGLSSFLFQCIFISLLIFIAFAVTGEVEVNQTNIMSVFLIYKNAYWFVWAYLFLYILAPVLNSFIDNTNKTTVKKVIILFFVIQTITFIFTKTDFSKDGYSPLSFIGLYLLARYFRLYGNNHGKYKYLAIYLICALCSTLIYFIPACLGNDRNSILTKSIAYTNPFNIAGALCLLLYFNNINLKSRFINWVASSCFAVYLFHMHFCIGDHYLRFAKNIYENFSGVTYLAVIIGFMIIVFAIAVLIDKARIPLFNQIWNAASRSKKV